jgi:hypothetical protein
MPCNDDEVNMNAPEAELPCTPPKPTGNGGAGRVDPDGQMNSDSEDSDEPQSLIRSGNGMAENHGR